MTRNSLFYPEILISFLLCRWTQIWQECKRLDETPILDIRAVKGSLDKAMLKNGFFFRFQHTSTYKALLITASRVCYSSLLRGRRKRRKLEVDIQV